MIFNWSFQGAEWPILQTIPWKKVNILTMTIEVEHSDEAQIVRYMARNGYEMRQRIDRVDLFFVKVK